MKILVDIQIEGEKDTLVEEFKGGIPCVGDVIHLGGSSVKQLVITGRYWTDYRDVLHCTVRAKKVDIL
jgi:hypothetical protein